MHITISLDNARLLTITDDTGAEVPHNLAPAKISCAELVHLQDYDAFLQLVKVTGFAYDMYNFTYSAPRGGDKLMRVYGLNGRARDKYISRCLTIDQKIILGRGVKVVRTSEYYPACALGYELDPEDYESAVCAVVAALPDNLHVCAVVLSGVDSHLSVDIKPEVDYLVSVDSRRRSQPTAQLVSDAQKSIQECCRANLLRLDQLEYYTNKRVIARINDIRDGKL